MGAGMTRDATPYAATAPRQPARAAGADVSAPVAGFYRHRVRSGSVPVGIYLWFGPPLDPITGEELDRSHRWQAHADGEPIDFEAVWPACTAHPITAAEYRQFIARKAWAKEHATASAYATTGKRVDPLSLDHPLPF